MSDIEWSPWIRYDGAGQCPEGVEEVPVSLRYRVDSYPFGDKGLTMGSAWNWNEGMEKYRIPMADYRRIYGDPMDTHPDSEPDADRYSVGADTVQYDPEDVAFSATSDGSTASYYQLPDGATELQHLISYRDMNAQDGEIFRAIYRKGRASHSNALRDAKKVLFYAQAEVERLEKYGE